VPRRRTLAEARYPMTAAFAGFLPGFRKDFTTVMWRIVWCAYDLLCEEVLGQVAVAEADEALETQVTALLEPCMQRCLRRDFPTFAWYVQHGALESETRLPAPARHREYDIAFVLNQNPRWKWPLEAKVLRTDGAVGDYANTLRERFLTCVYAPLSGEGAMLGYLVSGEPGRALAAIAVSVPCTMIQHPEFADRPHKTSEHRRQVPQGTPFAETLHCHHLILCLGGADPAPSSDPPASEAPRANDNTA